jgi:hypothetical protein
MNESQMFEQATLCLEQDDYENAIAFNNAQLKEDRIMNSNVFQELKQSLTDLYQEKLVKIILYGSQARGTATTDSDVDILVVLKDEVSAFDEILRMAEITTTIGLKYDELISIFPIAESRFLAQLTPLLQNVKSQGIVL